jgi:hypothetical protein
MSADTQTPGLPAADPWDWARLDCYVVSARFDFVFIIGSPLIAVAVVLGVASLLPPRTVEAYVLSFMAVGHHVPTFLRAYADPSEFAANRFRLIAAPLLLVALLLVLNAIDSRLIALTFVIDQFHFVRQNYGFMRIYDVKAGAAPKVRFNFDQWLSFSWFIWIIAESDLYSYIYAGSFFDAGMMFPAWFGVWARNGSLSVALLVSLLYLVELRSRRSRGEPIAVLKLALFATTYGVWYYSYVVLSDFILSYAISSFFHCLQYDAFAWHYNRKKAQTLPATKQNAFFRTVHAPNRLWMYVGSIFAYGFLSHILVTGAPAAVLLVNRMTGLLHYYYDSFIWRVRRQDFNRHL